MKLLLPQLLILTTTILAYRFQNTTKIIPSLSVPYDIDAYFISTALGLDGPKLSAINSSSWDWWYFDVVSLDLQFSLVIVFYTASTTAFPFLPPSESVLTIGVYAGYPNGSVSSTYLAGEEAVVKTAGQGSSGAFVGANAAWKNSHNGQEYEVEISSSSMGVFGSMKLVAKAKAHYPCGPVEAGQNMMVGPDIGWSNAVPDAVGTVNFTIQGSRINFVGAGYHDKNWSPQPFFQNVGSWYWGHGRLGPYSIVWFDFLSENGTNTVSAYISKLGKTIVSSCELGSITVRPSGGNDTYPPTIETGNPGGFRIVVKTDERGEDLTFNVKTDRIVLGAAGAMYTRWTGRLSAEIGGRRLEGGQALFEQFKLSA